MKFTSDYFLSGQTIIPNDLFDALESITRSKIIKKFAVEKLVKSVFRRLHEGSLYFCSSEVEYGKRKSIKDRIKSTVGDLIELQEIISNSKMRIPLMGDKCSQKHKTLELLSMAEPFKESLIFCLLAWSVADYDILQSFRSLRDVIKKKDGTNDEFARNSEEIYEWLKSVAQLNLYKDVRSLFPQELSDSLKLTFQDIIKVEKSIIHDFKHSALIHKDLHKAYLSKKPEKVWHKWALIIFRDSLVYSGLKQKEANRRIRVLFENLGIKIDVAKIIRLNSQQIALVDPRIVWNQLQLFKSFLTFKGVALNK